MSAALTPAGRHRWRQGFNIADKAPQMTSTTPEAPQRTHQPGRFVSIITHSATHFSPLLFGWILFIDLLPFESVLRRAGHKEVVHRKKVCYANLRRWFWSRCRFSYCRDNGSSRKCGYICFNRIGQARSFLLSAGSSAPGYSVSWSDASVSAYQ